jgi:hypothetical protein
VLCVAEFWEQQRRCVPCRAAAAQIVDSLRGVCYFLVGLNGYRTVNLCSLVCSEFSFLCSGWAGLLQSHAFTHPVGAGLRATACDVAIRYLHDL